MNENMFQRFLSLFKSRPGPKFIAQQLRKPSGKHALKVGEKMNQTNEVLYDLVVSSMHLQDGDRVLEIGFGNGKFFNKLFSKADNLQVNGIDYSEEMVEAAMENNPDSLTSRKLNIKWGRSDAIPFPDHSYDKVFCNMVIYFWKKPEDHLKEVHRVLKPGGRFYIGIRSRESMLNFPFVKHGFTLYDNKEWVDIMQDNGFRLVEINSEQDPEIEFDGKSIRLESSCIVAEKV